MYRQAIALALHERRPEAEVLLMPENVWDGQVGSFAPHMLVRNDGDGAVPEELLENVVCRVEILYTDHMNARVTLGDRVWTIEDATIDNLCALVDEAQQLISV